MFSSSLFPIILIIFPSAFEVDVAYFRISTFTILPSFTLSAYFLGIYISGIFLSFKETTNPKFLDFTKVPITNFPSASACALTLRRRISARKSMRSSTMW